MGLLKRKYFNKLYRAAFAIPSLSFTTDLMMFTVAATLGFNWYMLPFATFLYTLPVFIFFYLYYPRKYKPLIAIAGIVYVIIQLIETVFLRTINDYNGLTQAYIGLVLGFLALRGMIIAKNRSLYISTGKSGAYPNVFLDPMFWFMLGLTIFYIPSILNNSFVNQIIQFDFSKYVVTNSILAITLIIRRIIFTVGFYKIKERSVN